MTFPAEGDNFRTIWRSNPRQMWELTMDAYQCAIDYHYSVGNIHRARELLDALNEIRREGP